MRMGDNSMVTMTSFFLADLISDSDSSSTAAFDHQLHAKLVSSSGISFNTVRCLFRESASALEQEIRLLELEDVRTESCNVLAHWIPGRIEVMGKHTDYAGGNSLVCSTEGRGMAMVSTMAPAAGKHRKITIVSILAAGMDHHAINTSAPFKVNGRTVVHHTINMSDESRNKDDTANKDWRIYPTTTVRRLDKNFGLFAHLHETYITSVSGSEAQNEEKGYHIIIAISSNLPPASGLSTSSAFVTGLFLVLDSHLGIRSSQTYRQAIGTANEEDTVYNLSTYLGNIENGTCYTRQRVKRTELDANTEERKMVLEGTKRDGVGTFGGSEDHAAILMGKKRELRLLSFCPTRPASFAVNQLNGLIVCNSEDSNGEAEDVNQKSVLELPSTLVFVIAYSGARAEKAGHGTEASIGYNYASDMATKAFKAYNTCNTAAINVDEQNKLQTLADSIRHERKKQGISHICLSGDQIKKTLSDKILAGSAAVQGEDCSAVEDFGSLLVKRFEQFYEESELFVPAAAYCLSSEESDRLGMLGSIVDKSHRNAVNILKNQIDETAWLPLWARGIEHQLKTKPTLYVDDTETSEQTSKNPHRITALASSAFGAGFGGSCWALVHRGEAEEFLLQWQNAYDEAFPANDTREFFITEPGPGAFLI
jgi:galactokinase